MPMSIPIRRRAPAPRKIGRREFIRQGGHLALGLSLASQLGWQVGCGDSGSPGSGPSKAAWRDLEARLKGTLLRPGDPKYDTTGLATNLAYEKIRPQGIVLVAGAPDVQECVRWARENGLPAVPRSGGHSYAGYSSTEGLLIDLSPLQEIEIDPRKGLATLGGGALLGAVDTVASQQDLVVPSGRCVPVGIGGLVLGGGLGFNARKYGLTSDNLVHTRIVTANGDLLECDESTNPDLFWACRGGGGGNFGINVDFQIRAYPVATASVYKLTWPMAEAGAAWALVQDVAREAPDEFSLILAAAIGEPVGRPGVLEAIGQYLGPSHELAELLEPVLTHTNPTHAEIDELSIGDATTFLQQTGAPDAYLTKSAFIEDRLPEEAIVKMLDWISRFPEASRAADFAIFGWGGAINRVPPAETAFVHRSAAFVVEGDSSWHPGDPPGVIADSKAWIKEMFHDLAPYFTGAAYLNFIDPTQENWQAAYYGANLDRLKRVKRAVDPDNFFSFAQSIPL